MNITQKFIKEAFPNDLLGLQNKYNEVFMTLYENFKKDVSSSISDLFVYHTVEVILESYILRLYGLSNYNRMVMFHESTDPDLNDKLSSGDILIINVKGTELKFDYAYFSDYYTSNGRILNTDLIDNLDIAFIVYKILDFLEQNIQNFIYNCFTTIKNNVLYHRRNYYLSNVSGYEFAGHWVKFFPIKKDLLMTNFDRVTRRF